MGAAGADDPSDDRADRADALTDGLADTDADRVDARHATPTHILPLTRRSLSLAWSFGLGPSLGTPDVVHAPTLLAPPRRDSALVVTVHDDVPWTHAQALTRYGAFWHRRMGRRVAEDADAVVVPSMVTGERLVRVLPGLDPRRITVAANPLSARRMQALRQPATDESSRVARLALPADGYLLFVGTLEPRKGLDVLLSALSAPGGPQLPLLVVGPQGWGSVDVGSCGGRVRTLGRLDDDDLGVVYRHATAVVLPSRAEGFGYPVVEAMVAGVPVVTSDDPALVETGGGATMTVPVGDHQGLAEALRAVEDDSALRSSLTARGIARARDFDAGSYGRTMWSLYARL
jgi:glycosyltransferase involved in cell wall biosynthesis